jgi:hypothetical protein
MCTDKNEKEIGDDTKTRPNQTLPDLRDKDDPGADKRKAGGFDRVRQTHLLQSQVYGKRHGGENQKPNTTKQSSSISEDGPVAMPALREDEHPIIRSPYRQESDEQYPAEFADVMRLLSPSLSLAELYGDWKTAKALQILYEAINESGAMLHPFDPPQEIWRSLNPAARQRARVALDSGEWVMIQRHPLAYGVPGRVVKLRAYGNAICPQVAAEFVETVMEYLEGLCKPRRKSRSGSRAGYCSRR